MMDMLLAWLALVLDFEFSVGTEPSPQSPPPR